MANFWKIVNKVIDDADVLLLVLDARFVDETRNKEIEDKVFRADKPLIYVISKCDLVSQDKSEKYKKLLKPSVFISATHHLGTTMLRDRILIEGKRKYKDKEKFKVGVLGYPNVGKSSLINALRGRKVARTSILSGYTKGVQKVRTDNRIFMLDTPGVIPYQEKNFIKHAFIGSKDFVNVKDPELVVMELMQSFPGVIEKFYALTVKDDKEEVIDDIARRMNILKKGGEPDLERAARFILKDWQKGVIRCE